MKGKVPFWGVLISGHADGYTLAWGLWIRGHAVEHITRTSRQLHNFQTALGLREALIY